MANFIAVVYAVLKQEGIDTKGMDTDTAIAKYNELQKKSGGKAGKGEGTPNEQKKVKESNASNKDDLKDLREEEKSNYNKTTKAEHAKKITQQVKDIKKEFLERNDFDYKSQMKSFDEKAKKIKSNLKGNIDKYNFKKAIKNGSLENRFLAEKVFNEIVNGGVASVGDNNFISFGEDAQKIADEFSKDIEKGKEFLFNKANELIDENTKRVTNVFDKHEKEGTLRTEQYLKCFSEMSKIAKDKKWVISKSPYSDSFYISPEGESIDWGSKPENSYRLSDHWNFESRGEKHCRSDEIGNNEITIAQYRNGKYYKVG